MKFNTLVLSCLLLVGNIFASSVPGDFGKPTNVTKRKALEAKKEKEANQEEECSCCVNGPLADVFETNAKNRYAHKYLKPEFVRPYSINHKFSANVITALQLLSQEVSYRNKDGVLIELTVNKNDKTVLLLGDCEKYKLYKKALEKPEIKDWLENIPHHVPSGSIYQNFKAKLLPRCVNGPLADVFETNAKNRYAHKYLKPEFVRPYSINHKLSANVITALQLLSQEVSYRNKDGVLIELTVNKNDKTVLLLDDCEKYKLYKKALEKPEIKDWLENIPHHVPSGSIYQNFKAKLLPQAKIS